MAAAFDPELALEWGTAMGEEFWAKGTNIQEGPGVCIARVPRNGRTFEYISGEDPVLGATLAAQVVSGIQKNVMAITKHYIMVTAKKSLMHSLSTNIMLRIFRIIRRLTGTVTTRSWTKRR